ncbi:MAG: clan AA aspartic protease [Chloroflexi bacterium]|nr:clan AA aspartic protease [Chloroflexota bacterium]
MVMHVTATVRNPADPERFWEGSFLVDTAATDCLVPRQLLEAIGLEAKGERIYGLADGSEHRVSVTTGRVELMGEVVGTTILMGDEDSAPVMGMTAFASAGIEVDPRNQTLKRLPFVRLR